MNSEERSEEQQARQDEHVAGVREEIMGQLRQSPSTWKTDQNYHALSVEARFKEEDILQFIARNINIRDDLILRHVLKVFRDAVEDHLEEYMETIE